MQSIKFSVLLTLFVLSLASPALAWDDDPPAKPTDKTANDIGTNVGTSESSSDADTTKASFVICRNQKNVRTVRVDKVGSTFVAIYTRLGVDKEVGRGRNYDSILKIMQNVRINLEKSNWKCKETAKVTSTVGRHADH